MKRYLAFALVALLALSCTKDDNAPEAALQNENVEEEIFYASIEDETAPGTGTKVYADENLSLLWNEDDRISIFNKKTRNDLYAFTGEDGDNSGDFELVSINTSASYTSLDNIYAVYPYSEDNTINSTGEQITVTLPATQEYKEHSFGIGANTMVAVTDNTFLGFRNVCGFLKFRFYGDNVKVSSVTLEGNNGELISGKAAIIVSPTEAPSIAMDHNATTSVTINCPKRFTLGSSSTDYTEFIFALPPVRFSQGFKITVTTPDGGVFEKSSTKSLTIPRNKMESMGAMKVVPSEVYSYVDLGLPSGIKWATCNIGAKSPEKAGYYYAWGERAIKTYYDWSTYKYCNQTYTAITKYCLLPSFGTVDNKTHLDYDDDAAHYTRSGNWRMPTKEEFEELINNCTLSLVTQNGVKGLRITGPNNKRIFLPVTGYKDADSIKNSASGYYWTSSINTEKSSSGRRLNFNNQIPSEVGLATRIYGFPIRPVHYDDPASGVTGISLNLSAATLSAGDSMSLTATVSAKAGAVNKGVEWSSSNKSVATVDYTGKITAISAGTATITATTVFGGFSATCNITVVSSGS